MKGTKVKSNKGITLVALVITIIILLILAVVAINAVSGDGIIGKAKEAGSSYNEKATAENTELARQVGLIEETLGIEKVGEGTFVADGLIRDASNGLLYQILNEETKTVSVLPDRGDIDYTASHTYSDILMGEYTVYDWITATPVTKGNVKIPISVKAGGNTYTIVALGSFSGTQITDITIPDSVTCIDNNVFSNCANLNNIAIGNGVTNIEQMAFYGCPNVKSVTIGRSLSSLEGLPIISNSINVSEENEVYSSDNGILFNKNKTILLKCPPNTTMTNYVIPNSVTSIGMGAFNGCTKLSSIVIPDSIKRFDSSEFLNCSSLKDIYIESNDFTVGVGATMVKTFCNIASGSTIYVRNAEVAAALEGTYDSNLTTISDNYTWTAPTE